MRSTSFLMLPFLASLLAIGCNKNDNTLPEKYDISYGDSIFYVRTQAGDYFINPLESRSNGEYFGYPEGIEIDSKTGTINVSKSETGLRYLISFVDATTGDTCSTVILISGINYYDKIYNLSNNDTLALPVYNASPSRNIPLNSSFDEGNGCNGVGVSVNVNSAVINLAQTIRNGVFGVTPSNGAQKEVELKYRVNDGSNKTLNSLKVKLYYFNTAADITPDLVQLLQDRQGTVFGANFQFNSSYEFLSGTAGSGTAKGVARPRPPCIFIVGR